jgi:hypothetical protein
MNKTKIAISETVPLTYTSLAAKCHTKLTIVLFHYLKATYFFWKFITTRRSGLEQVRMYFLPGGHPSFIQAELFIRMAMEQ